jgi:hypothetical protein
LAIAFLEIKGMTARAGIFQENAPAAENVSCHKKMKKLKHLPADGSPAKNLFFGNCSETKFSEGPLSGFTPQGCPAYP